MSLGDAPKSEAKKGLEMKDIEVGSVIEDGAGNKLRIEQITRNPKYEKDGVPFSIDGKFLGSGISFGLTFGVVSPQQPVDDWKRWKVISKPE